jgi:type IV pilus assembly protein PilO
MAKWSELPVKTQLGIVIGVAIAATAAMWFMVFQPIKDQNTQTAQSLTAVKAENDSLRPYEKKLKDLDAQIYSLGQQLEQMKQIVPDEKEADNFIRMVQATAATAGIEVRSYTAKPTASKEFFVESPWDLNIDGPYYSVLAFFDKMAKLDRIVNVSNLQMATVEKPGDAKVRRRYNYAPTETVVASCTATTYFSHDVLPATAQSAAQPVKK